MGILIALISASFTSLSSVFLKKLDGISPNALTFVREVSAIPILAIIVTLFVGWEIPALPFWIILIIFLLPTEILLGYLTTKALHLAPMSLVAPLGAFTSIFLIPVGYFILGELPTRVGLFGVLIIFVGSLVLGWESSVKWQNGFKNLVTSRGSLLAIAAAFVASIAVSLIKLTYAYANPLISATYLVGLMAIVLSYTSIKQLKHAKKYSHIKPEDVVGLSAVSGIGTAAHFVGLSLMPAAYFISIKRLSIVFSVFLGKTVFDESHVLSRLIGATLMVVGVTLIALG